MDKETSRNLIIAIALSVGIMVAFQWLFPPPRPPVTTTAPATAPGPTAVSPEASITGEGSVPGPATGSPSTAVGGVPPLKALSRTEALATTPRVTIDSPAVQGSIALTGGRIDDIVLRNYRETVDPSSPNITLLQPPQTIGAYYAQFGWTGEAGVKVPNAETVWETSGKTLSPQTPITLTWNNGAGLIFERTFRLDEHYMITVEQKVRNQTDKPVILYPYAFITRSGRPQLLGFYILHEGLLGVFDDTLQEVKYADVEKTGRIESASQKGGWIGITDKYWLAAVGFDQKMKVAASMTHTATNGRDRYQTDLRGEPLSIAPGEEKSVNAYVFAGAKELELLDRIATDPGLTQFDLAIDFGWFYFLTKPFFYALRWLHGLLGNFGLVRK